MTINRTVDVDVEIDVNELLDEMTVRERKRFLREVTLDSIDTWQDFVYELEDDETADLIRWLKFYDKIKG